MLEYGILFNGSFAEQLRNSWYDFANLMRSVPSYWYLVAIALLILLIRLISRK